MTHDSKFHLATIPIVYGRPGRVLYLRPHLRRNDPPVMVGTGIHHGVTGGPMKTFTRIHLEP